jgi:hypothetical protein
VRSWRIPHASRVGEVFAAEGECVRAAQVERFLISKELTMKSPFQIPKHPTRARRWPHLAWLQATILALALPGSMAAEGPIASVQESLKRQQFYFGEATGIVDDDTRAALRRFQIRHGLPCTGEIDGATLQALAGNPAAVQPISEAQVAASKAAPQPTPAVVDKDRQFLQKIETGIEPPPAVQTAPPAAPTSPPPAPAPPIAAPQPVPPVAVSKPAETPAPSRSVNPPASVPMRSTATVSFPPVPVRREVAAPSQPTAPTAAVKPTYIEMNEGSDAPRQEAPKPVTASRQSLEKPRESTSSNTEKPRTVQSRTVPGAREVKPPSIASAPSRRAEVETSAPPSQVAVEQNPPGALPTRGTTVTRTTTTGTGPDGRTYIYEKTTTTTTGKATPEIRRAIPVEPRRKAGGFKLFKDDDN